MSTFQNIKIKKQVKKQKQQATKQINKYEHLNKKY